MYVCTSVCTSVFVYQCVLAVCAFIRRSVYTHVYLTKPHSCSYYNYIPTCIPPAQVMCTGHEWLGQSKNTLVSTTSTKSTTNNSTVASSQLTVGSRVNLACRSGYEMSDGSTNRTSVCTTDGDFDPPLENCTGELGCYVLPLGAMVEANSKHWFTTSFFQPLP